MIKVKNNTESLGLYEGEVYESVEEMRSLVSDWLLEGGMENTKEREQYIERWMEEVSYEECEEEENPYRGYVKIGEQYFILLPTENGFDIYDDDQMWKNGFGIANGKEIEAVDESEVPEEDRYRLGWILEQETE